MLGVSYTFSKAIDYADNDANPRIQYMPDAARNRGLAGYDRTNNFVAYGVWDIPFGRGHRWAAEGPLSRLVGGWQLNGILSAMRGTPIFIVQNSGGNLNAGGSAQVPDQVKSTVAILGGIGTGHPYFDTTACAAVNIPSGQPQRFGNAGRDNIRGPGLFDIDMSLFRTFSLSERFKLQFRAEALNALNHPNFSNPAADVSSSASFGFITSTTNLVAGERDFRFAARFSF